MSVAIVVVNRYFKNDFFRKVLKEILPIYSRYMVCYTLDEQNEIINEFLGVIDINDKKRLIKDEIDMCKICKFNPRNLNMYRILPSTIAKDICKYNYKECKNATS